MTGPHDPTAPLDRREPALAAAVREAAAGFSSQLELAGRNVLLVRRPGRVTDPPAEVRVRYGVRAAGEALHVLAGPAGAGVPRWAGGLRFPLLTVAAAGAGFRVACRFPGPAGTYAEAAPDAESAGRLAAAWLKDLLNRPLSELARP